MEHGFITQASQAMVEDLTKNPEINSIAKKALMSLKDF